MECLRHKFVVALCPRFRKGDSKRNADAYSNHFTGFRIKYGMTQKDLSSLCKGQCPTTRRSIMAQSGRSMVEIIGVMAVMGVLIIGGIAGYKYAIDKAKANHIMKDVELAYVAVSASSDRENIGLTEYTDAVSGFPTFTERIMDEDFQTDIVLVKHVPESVCDKVLEMAEPTQWIVSSVETDTNYLYPLTECSDANVLVFSLADIRDFLYECDKECPTNMMCGVNDECICATGYEMDDTGECVKKTCNATLAPELQPDRYCCESMGGVWNYDIEPQMCGCPEGYFFNGKECAVDNWCSYTYTVPELFQAFQYDCAYNYTVPDTFQAFQYDCAYNYTVTNTDGVLTTTMSQTKSCGSGQYCILNWINEGCTTNVKTYAAGTTTTIYGRCAPHNEYYNICQTKTEGEASLTQIKSCGSGEYCILNWINEGCTTNVKTYAAGTTTTLYGRCAPHNEYYNICQTKTEGEVQMIPQKQCSDGMYCFISWANTKAGNGWSCSAVKTYAANTSQNLFGVCLDHNSFEKQSCPFKF